MNMQSQPILEAHLTLPAVSEQWKANFSSWMNFHYHFAQHSSEYA